MLCYPSSMLSFLMYTYSSYLLSSSALLQYQAKPSNWREDLEDQPTRGQGYKGETSPGTEYFPIYFMMNLTFLICSMTSSLSSLLYSSPLFSSLFFYSLFCFNKTTSVAIICRILLHLLFLIIFTVLLHAFYFAPFSSLSYFALFLFFLIFPLYFFFIFIRPRSVQQTEEQERNARK